MDSVSRVWSERSFWFCWRLLPLHRLKHSRMLLRPLRLMLMLFCITPTITTATMDSHGMSLDARGVKLKLKLPLMLMPMLMLVSCTAFTTPTTTSATMDIPGMCLDAIGVKLKLPLMLMLMPDIMDTILIMVMEDTMATILDKHYTELERDAYSGNLHVNAHLASSTNQNIKSEQLILHPFGTKVYTHVYLEIKILN